MAAKRDHCRAITQTPGTGQALTSLDMKLNAVVEITDTILMTQRQLPWKVFFPPNDYSTTTTTGTVTPSTFI